MITQALTDKAGDDIRLQFAVKDLDGAPSPITGAAVRFVIARSKADPAISTEVSPATATVIRTPTNDGAGIFHVTVAGADTQALRGDYYWEVEVEDSLGKKQTPLGGNYTFTADLV